MAVETNDGYGNGEIIYHPVVKSERQCTKCKLKEMTPTFHPRGSHCKFNRHIENVKTFMRNDTYCNSDEVTKEHIVWLCPECGYEVAKEIQP